MARVYSCFCFRQPLAPPLFPYTTLFRSAGRTDDFVPSAPRLRVAASPVAGIAGRRDLHTHVAEALLHRPPRSEEHTSELQSRGHLVCRLLLEKNNFLCQIHDAAPALTVD